MATILFSVAAERHRLGTELSAEELAAIGFVTVAWAQLEHLLFRRTAELASEAKASIPEDATALPLKKRLRALRSLAEETLSCSTDKKKLLDLLTSVSDAARSRHQITHGVWDWAFSDPDKLQVSSLRPPYRFEEPFDFKKLVALGRVPGRGVGVGRPGSPWRVGPLWFMRPRRARE